MARVTDTVFKHDLNTITTSPHTSTYDRCYETRAGNAPHPTREPGNLKPWVPPLVAKGHLQNLRRPTLVSPVQQMHWGCNILAVP